MRDPKIELTTYYIYANDKLRLKRSLDREISPDVKEIIRRFNADEEDFNHDKIKTIPYKVITNERYPIDAISDIVHDLGHKYSNVLT